MRGLVVLGIIILTAYGITFMASYLSIGSMPSSEYISTPLYKPGDVIYIKPDSSKGVVVDVFKSDMLDSINHYKVHMGGGNKQIIRECEIYEK